MKTIGKNLLLFGIYLLVAIGMTWPTAQKMRTHMPGGMGDPLLSCWILERNIHRYLTLDFHNFQESTMFYPHTKTMAYSEFFVVTSAMAVPFYLLSGGDIVVTYNLLLIFCLAMTAWGVHLLVRELTNRGPPAALAAIIFAFAPLRIGQIEHLHMVTTQWIPFIFLYLHRFAKSLNYRDALRVAVFFILNALTTAFYMVVATLCLAIFVPILFWSSWREWKRILGPAIVAGVLIFITVIPVYKPYMDVRDQLGFKRNLAENQLYSAKPLSWLGIPVWQGKNLIYGRLLHFERFSQAEGSLFPGMLAPLLALLLLGAALARKHQWRAEHTAYLAITIAGFLVAFGPAFRPGLMNPFFMFYYNYFPGGNSHRVPARYAIVVLFGLAVLAGYAAAWLMERKNRVFSRLAVILPAIAILECVSVPIGIEPRPDIKEVSEVYAWLAHQPKNTAIIEIPVNNFWLNAQDVFMSRLHGQPMMNGYSSYCPPLFNYLAGPSSRLLGDECLDVFKRIGVTYLVVHNDLIEDKDYKTFKAARKAALLTGKLVLVKDIDDTAVYEVVGHAAAFAFPRNIADLPDTVTLRVPGRLAPGKKRSYTGALTFEGQTPWIIMSGLVIPENRTVELTFSDATGKVVKHQKSRLETTAPGIANFVFTAPDRQGSYEMQVASRGKIVGKRLISVEDGLGTSVKPAKLLAGIQTTTDPVATGSMEVLSFRVNVSNAGNAVWLSCPGGVDGKPVGEVRLGYALLKNDVRVQESRVRLPYDIGPGDSVGLDLVFRAPADPGSYRLKLDMVSELVRWFEEDGSQPVFIDMEIGKNADAGN
jgi:hypothetical protein